MFSRRAATIAPMNWRAYVLAAVAGLPMSMATAQGDLSALLASVPDEALAVVAVVDPQAAAQALTTVFEPAPAGLPPDLVARLGIGLTAMRVVLEGDTAAWLQRMAGGGAVVALLPTTGPGGFELLAVTRPPDLAAATAWCARHPQRLQHAAVGEHLLLARTGDGLQLLRARAGAPPGRWATSELATAPGPTGGLAALVDLAGVRRLLGERRPQLARLGGAARFVLAPIVHALAAAPWLHVGITAADARLRVVLHADASVLQTPFGALLANGETAVERPALPAGGLLSLCLDRSLRALLSDPARFLEPDDVLAVQGFLSIADAVDGARSSFVDDLVGGLREPITLHVLAPAPAAADDVLPIVLPEFVVMAEVADEAVADVLLRAAQVLATIVNAERAQRRQAPFVVRRRQDESGRGLVAEPPPWRGPGAAPVDRQLSPTLWIGRGRVVLASTQRAARATIARGHANSPLVAGDRLVLRGPAIGAMIERSRSALALARMLDEGERADEAQRFFTTVAAFADAVAELSASATVGSGTTRLVLELQRQP
jgi:hypothetical protein